MTERATFCKELRERLDRFRDKVLLRIAVAPNFDAPIELTGTDIRQRAEELARSLPIRSDAVVLLLLPHSPELFLLQLGLVLRGQIPGILAWPTTRVDADKYQRNLAHQLGHLPAGLLVTVPPLAANLSGMLPYPVCSVSVANDAAFGKLFPSYPVAERSQAESISRRAATKTVDALFLQFSGGTTGAQKAIVVTTPMLLAQFEQLQAALNFGEQDSVVSWLPMYHDMGLIACYWMPLWHGACSTQIAANDWVLNPELLLKYVSRYHARFSWLPNFAFSYLAQRRESMQGTYDLGSVRGWINCSEPVHLNSIREFAAAFGDWGVREETIQSSYAMAETVFAITQSELGKSLKTFSRSSVKHGCGVTGELAFDLPDRDYVTSGRSIPRTEIKIVAPGGVPCRETMAGEIQVHTPSLFAGYWGNEGFQTHSLQDGWHATGDYGFVADGELFVIGRLKDIVIVGGNNIFPEDVEAVVNTVPGVYPGRAVAFGVDDHEYGTQSLAVVAEMKDEFGADATAGIEAGIRKSVLTAVGTAPRHVAVVPGRWIVKSTAGKISRRETRERFLREKIAGAKERSEG